MNRRTSTSHSETIPERCTAETTCDEAAGGDTPVSVPRPRPRSAWGSLLTKSAGIVVSLTALGGIGAASILAESRGTLVAPPASSDTPASVPSARPDNTGTDTARDTVLSSQASLADPVWLKPSGNSATTGHDGARAGAPTTGDGSSTRGGNAPDQSSPGTPAPGDPQADQDVTDEPKRSGVTKDGKVILNVADVGELTRLPGVGRKRAEAIVRLRERLGRLRKTTDLLRVKGIGVKTLKKMLPYLVLDPPEE